MGHVYWWQTVPILQLKWYHSQRFQMLLIAKPYMKLVLLKISEFYAQTIPSYSAYITCIASGSRTCYRTHKTVTRLTWSSKFLGSPSNLCYRTASELRTIQNDVRWRLARYKGFLSRNIEIICNPTRSESIGSCTIFILTLSDLDFHLLGSLHVFTVCKMSMVTKWNHS